VSPKPHLLFTMFLKSSLQANKKLCRSLRTLSANTTSQLDILGHDCNALGVNSTKVGILKEPDEVGFGGFLESKDSRSLEAKISLKVLGDFTYQTLEGDYKGEESDQRRSTACSLQIKILLTFPDEKISRLLVTSDLAKGHSSRTVPVGLLHASGGWGGLAGSLGGELLAGSLSSGGLTGSLLGTGHFEIVIVFWRSGFGWVLIL
jgi:hypothetical protein